MAGSTFCLLPRPSRIAAAVSDLLKSDLAKDFKILHVDNSTGRPVGLFSTLAEEMVISI